MFGSVPTWLQREIHKMCVERIPSSTVTVGPFLNWYEYLISNLPLIYSFESKLQLKMCQERDR